MRGIFHSRTRTLDLPEALRETAQIADVELLVGEAQHAVLGRAPAGSGQTAARLPASRRCRERLRRGPRRSVRWTACVCFPNCHLQAIWNSVSGPGSNPNPVMCVLHRRAGIASGERARNCRCCGFPCHCERSESDLEPVGHYNQDCRVASLLAMTGYLKIDDSLDCPGTAGCCASPPGAAVAAGGFGQRRTSWQRSQ